MKKLVRSLTLVFLLGIGGPGAWAQGIPVVDATSIAQLVIQAQQMAKDYEQFKAQTQSLTGQIQAFKNVNSAQSMLQALNVGQQVLQQVNTTYGVVPVDYLTRMGATTNAVQAAMSQLGGQQGNLNIEAQRIYDLASQSQAAQGQLEAQQAGNQINVELVQQLQMLRAQQLAQAQAQNAVLLQQQQRDADKAEVTKDFLGRSNRIMTVDEIRQQYSPSLR